jgi:hypothetical protein
MGPVRPGGHVVQDTGHPSVADALGAIEEPVVALAGPERAVDRDDLHRAQYGGRTDE